MASVTRRLSTKEVPDNSLIAVFSDVHIPHHDEKSLRLMIDCCEAEGVTHVILNGDIADCGPASRHPKKKRLAELDEGALRESIAPGLWFYEWARTRPCWYILGNHEGWVEDYINLSSELRGMEAIELMGLPADGDGWEVLPNRSRLMYGTRCWEHGNRLFPTGGGGPNPWNTIKKKAPNRTTSIGHLHTTFSVPWTVPDADDVPVTHAAIGNGHISRPEAHEDYAADANWQVSFELTRVNIVGRKPMFTTYQPMIQRDARNRPVLEFNGRVYR